MDSNGTGPASPVSISRLIGLARPKRSGWLTEHGTQWVGQPKEPYKRVGDADSSNPSSPVMIHYGTMRYDKPLSPGCELGAFESLSLPHSSGETKTGIPPAPTPLKERRSDRCQGREAGPEPRAAAGEHGEDLPLDSRRARSCYALRRLRDIRAWGLRWPPNVLFLV